MLRFVHIMYQVKVLNEEQCPLLMTIKSNTSSNHNCFMFTKKRTYLHKANENSAVVLYIERENRVRKD